MTARPVLTLKRPKRGERGQKRAAKNGTKATTADTPPPQAVSDDELLAELRAVAPDLWNAEAPVPLAIGIHKQLYPLVERLQVSRRSLRKFLGRWTSTRAYQRALSEPGAQRVNLDGSPAGEVAEQHGASARQRIGS